MADFQNRDAWDLPAWPEMYDILKQLQGTIVLSPPGPELNMMVFTMASLTAGCRHCQAHGAYGLDKMGVPMEKIRSIWSFETSDAFDDRERAALRFAMASAASPNAVTAEHHADLRAHFSDAEVRALIGTSAAAAFMNRYNDSLATVTDQVSVDWAEEHLGDLGWDIGKHLGALSEQRDGSPFG